MKTRNVYEKSPRAAAAAFLFAMAFLLVACGKSDEAGGGDNQAKSGQSEAASASGVGPVKKVTLGALDEGLAAKGEKIFSGTCAACHKLDQRYVGPGLAGVTQRRTPEWIMNMVMNPTEMTQKDPVAKALLAEYMTQMSVSVSEEEARAILEYFRKVDGQ
ncbi:MAG: cytochrome c class [Fibrobacteria bacterium]|jgi:mono/diheme cytochrome c family protein|nr:cytochrome c class [Fibrobacteria bacterium]